MLTIGIDLGGTFTDGYFWSDGRALTRKVPTYRFDLTRSVIECLRAAAEAYEEPLRAFLERVDLLRIATTVGTNSVIEGTGSRVGLMVASGQEQLLYADEAPVNLFEHFLDPGLVRGLDLPLDPDSVLEVARSVVSHGVRQVVVSFPGAIDAREPEHAIRGIVRKRYPPHYLRSVPLQIGTDVAPSGNDEIRTATAVVNAYLHRDVARLLYGAEQELRNEGLESPVVVVHANSGVARIGKTTAIHTYSSGPAAGLSAAEMIAELYGESYVLTADMGGTTTDFGVVVDARCEIEARPSLAGVRVALPMLRTESVGCAGCSFVKVVDGHVSLGPESAGAAPGPAAFGLGGEFPTLTDADLVSGLVAGGKEVGGQFVLSEARARTALEAHVGAPLGVSAEAAAAAVEGAAARLLANELLGLLGRAGLDPAEVVVYAFGGAGPTHLWGAAALAGIRKVRSFSFGSAFSALGCTVVDLRHRYELPWDGEASLEHDLTGLVESLLAQGLADLRAEKIETTGILLALRLLGPDGETIALADVASGDQPEAARALVDRALGALAPGLSPQGLAVEVIGRIQRTALSAPESASHELTLAPERTVWWGGEPVQTPVIRWGDAAAGKPITGPVIIEELDCTHAIGPGWRVTVNDRGTALWEAEG